MSKSPFEPQQSGQLDIEIRGIQDDACQQAVNKAMKLLGKKLPRSVQELVVATKITIADNLIESGGLTRAKAKEIILDATKNALSLQSAEDFLVGAGYLEPGDWTKALPSSKNQAWSCLTYQFIHEFGHLIDGLSKGSSYERLGTESSPTKYGKTSLSESFAEAFTYWVFDLTLAREAQQTVSATLAQPNVA